MDPVAGLRLHGGASALPAEADPRLALASLTAVLRAAARRVRGREDTEAVHDLRVACRRLEGTLWLWQPLFDEELAARLRARLRRLRRRLSGVRDAEVAVELLERVLAPPHGAPPAVPLPPRVERWLMRGRRERDRMLRRISALARQRRIGRLEGQAAALAAAMTPPSPEAEAEVRRRLARRLAALKRLLHAPHPPIHALRITIKRCRYALESWETVTASPAPLELARLTAAQRRLGRLRDAGLIAQRLAVREQRWRSSGHSSAERWAAARRDALRQELIAEWRAFRPEWNALREWSASPAAPA
ncbi:MAG: CHAD domain-containing protein [Candidatus Eiseniibacteriota bacterium]